MKIYIFCTANYDCYGSQIAGEPIKASFNRNKLIAWANEHYRNWGGSYSSYMIDTVEVI